MRLAVQAGHFEGVPVEMDGMVVGALVLHDKPIALALVQRHRVGFRIRFAVDHPVVEVAMTAKFRLEEQRNAHIGFTRRRLRFGERAVVP